MTNFTRSRFMKTMLIGLTALIAASCEDGDGLLEPTLQNLAGLYKPIAHTTQVHGTSAVVDVYATYTPCYFDNYLQINADGTYTFRDDGLECTPSFDNTGTWALPSRSTMLVNGIPYEIEFDGRTLIQRAYERAGSSTTIRTITMVKQ